MIDFAILGLCMAISVLMSYLAIGTRPNRLEAFFLVTGVGAAVLFAGFELVDLFVWHHWGETSVSRYAGARMVAAGDWMLFSIVASAIVAAPIRWIARIVGLAGAWLAFSLSSFEIVPTLTPLATPLRSGSIVLGIVALVITLQSWLLARRSALRP
ncbi:MAG TPA: hypothetical protein VMA09_01675 [Candidatus Binataceae bacterium]|nr:hypothetical protein [Candidatus Binataceae bacterium]